MPLYAKILKDILSKKRKIAEEGIVNLTSICSAVIKRGLPEKMKDPVASPFPAPLDSLSFKKLSVTQVPVSI